MFIVFCISQVIAGFCMIVFGAGMIESPDTVNLIIGAMFCFVGIILIIMYTQLIDKILRKEIF